MIAQGQITLVDYNDAVSLNAYIGSNQPLTQIYTQDTLSYVPDWTTGSFLKLTPQLYKSGSSTDIMVDGTGIQKVEWVTTNAGTSTTVATWISGTGVSGGDASHILKATAPWDLTIKINELATAAQKNYECIITWKDTNTDLDIVVKSSISFSKMTNPGSLITAICYAPSGTVFRNGGVVSLKAHCDFWRGAAVDASSVNYRWFKNDPAVTTTGHANYHAEGGIGWGEIKATNTYSGVTNYTTNEITIPDATVLNYATFKCACKDTDSGSTTYNQVVYDTISFADQSDPVQVVVSSTAGNVFRNGTGSTSLTAVLWRAAEQIDTEGDDYTYTWTKYASNGIDTVNFYSTGSPIKAGKTIAVDGNDVDGKNVFTVAITTLT